MNSKASNKRINVEDLSEEEFELKKQKKKSSSKKNEEKSQKKSKESPKIDEEEFIENNQQNTSQQSKIPRVDKSDNIIITSNTQKDQMEENTDNTRDIAKNKERKEIEVSDNNNDEKGRKKIQIDMEEIIDEYDAVVFDTFELVFTGVNTRKMNLDMLVSTCREMVSDVETVIVQESRQWTANKEKKEKKEMMVVAFSNKEARKNAMEGITSFIEEDKEREFCETIFEREQDEKESSDKREIIPNVCVIGGVLVHQKIVPTIEEIRERLKEGYVTSGDIVKIAINERKKWITIIMEDVKDYQNIMSKDHINGNKWYIRISHASGKVNIPGYFRLRFAPFPPVRTDACGIISSFKAMLRKNTAENPENIISAGQMRKEKNIGAGYGFMVIRTRETAEEIINMEITHKSRKKNVTKENGVEKVSWDMVEFVTQFEYSLFTS